MGDETAEEGASTTAPVMPESEAERSGEAEAHAGATDGPNADSAPIAGVGETNASTPEESVAEADQPEATEPEVDASEVVNPEVTDHGNSNPDTDAAAEETPPNEAQQTVDPGDQRCGVVALIGAPNVGKSTLVNQLVGAKVSIVTHKVQTTRARVRGVLTEDDTQIILVDTPGIFRPKRRLDRAMVDAAWAGADDADVVCFLVDAARGLDADGTRILERLDGTARPVVLILNKIDLIERSSLLALIAELAAKREFAATML
ncbi:MAG: GTPase Era, partial [Pseudomonadota bacterium]